MTSLNLITTHILTHINVSNFEITTFALQVHLHNIASRINVTFKLNTVETVLRTVP